MERIANFLTGTGLAVLGGGLLAYNCFYTVDAGYRAVIFDKAFGGVKEVVVGEGMHFYIPMI